MVADPKNTIVTSEIAPQFLLLKLHFGKAEFGILVKSIRNIVHFLHKRLREEKVRKLVQVRCKSDASAIV